MNRTSIMRRGALAAIAEVTAQSFSEGPLSGRGRRNVMTDVEIYGDALIVHVRGMDRLFSLKSCLEIPLSHVLGAVADPQIAGGHSRGLRAPGTHLPGVITAGTFYQEGDRVFWNVRDPEKAIVIRLEDERYARLVIEVEDPTSTVAAIEEAMDQRRGPGSPPDKGATK
jgi:hypothetical protein